MLITAIRLLTVSIFLRQTTTRPAVPVQVMITEDGHGFQAELPRIPGVIITGRTLDETLASVRTLVSAYRAHHRGRLPETRVDFSFLGRDITPSGVTDLQVFVPADQPPIPPDVETWAAGILNDLKDAGRVAAHGR